MGMAKEVVRTFWHGEPLNPYQLAGLRSFAERGHSIEVFSYQRLDMPPWISLRDAREIWHSSDILRYEEGPGRGSPALHSNLFRYAMLYKLGGWWIDMDMVLLKPELPEDEFFFARQDEKVIAIGAVKFPKEHPLLNEAVKRFIPGKTDYYWSQTGPLLFSELIAQYDLQKWAREPISTYPIHWDYAFSFFDPAQRDQVDELCSRSTFTHLSNEIWRRAGVPMTLAPPPGSWLEALLDQYGMLHQFSGCMSLSNVRQWFENLAAGQGYMHDAEGRLRQERLRAADMEKMFLRRISEAEDQATIANGRIAELEESTSWQMTAPFRYLSTMARKLLKG